MSPRIDRGRSGIGHSGDCGSVLILTVWTVLILSVLSVAVAARAIGLIEGARMFRSRVISYRAARAGVVHAMARVMTSTNASGPVSLCSETPEAWSGKVGDGYFSIRCLSGTSDAHAVTNFGLIDEDRRLDLGSVTNDAGYRILYGILVVAGGMDSDEATRLADSIADWVDEDSVPREFGAESYAGVECRNGRVASVDELLLVRGMSREKLERIRDCLTICDTRGKLNINTVDETVLRALGVAVSLSDDSIPRELAALLIEYRQANGPIEVLEKNVLRRSLFPQGLKTREHRAAWVALEWLLNHRVLSTRGTYFRGTSVGAASGGNAAGSSIDFVCEAGSGHLLYWFEK